jgi:nucleoside-diphosphate-sugar epimerase
MFGAEKKYMKPVNEPFANLANISKAKELLDWEPLKDLDSWIKEYKFSNRINIK